MRRPPSSDYRHLRLRLAASLTKAGKYKPATPLDATMTGRCVTTGAPGFREAIARMPPCPARAPSQTDGRQGPGFRSVMCICSMPESTEDPFLPHGALHAFLDHASGRMGGLNCLPDRQSGRVPCHFADSTSVRRFCCAALPPSVVHFCDVTCCNVRVMNVRTPQPASQEGLAP